MGGTAGEMVTVRIQGEHVEDPEALLFSHPGITATPRLDDMGAVSYTHLTLPTSSQV